MCFYGLPDPANASENDFWQIEKIVQSAFDIFLDTYFIMLVLTNEWTHITNEKWFPHTHKY